ncbi:MAG: hypothetical protein HY063_10165 [Bacteroidetes bacterium]|nr:hypothetical protein [Bacteroidota bacterium]
MWNTNKQNKKSVTSRYISGKTKIIITAMFFSSVTYNMYAQLPTAQEKGNNYKLGCSVAINSIQGQMGFPGGAVIALDENGNMQNGGNRISKSLSLSIIPKYFINNDFLLRIEFGRTNINQQIKEDFYETSVHYINNDTVKQSITRFAPAIQWNYVRKNFFEAYSGMSIIYMDYGKYSENFYGEDRDSATSVLIFSRKENTIIDGGYAAGIGAFTGFNIYLQKHISIGAEFSSSFLYYKLGGKRIVTDINQSFPNPPATTINNWTASYKGFRFSNILSSFNISFWF